jgi:diguanylate cyclase (GGDEF)-like protein/PAS domain S-box-containing protein
MAKTDICQTVLDQLPEGVCYIGRDLTISYWNRTAEQLTGFARADVVGRRCADNLLACTGREDESLCEGDCPLMATLEDGRSREATTFVRCKDGHRVPVMIHVAAVRDGSNGGDITGVIQTFTENSRRAAIGDRFDAAGDSMLLDPVTCLPNRRYLEDELSVRLAEFDKFGRPFGVLFLGLDGLKRVRTEHGAEVGDEIVRAVAGTIVHSSRPMDALGRWSSTELFGIVRNVGRSGLKKAAERLRILVKKTELSGQGTTIKIGASIGGAVARRGDTVESLLQRADRMLSECHAGGTNRVRIEGR